MPDVARSGPGAARDTLPTAVGSSAWDVHRDRRPGARGVGSRATASTPASRGYRLAKSANRNSHADPQQPVGPVDVMSCRVVRRLRRHPQCAVMLCCWQLPIRPYPLVLLTFGRFTGQRAPGSGIPQRDDLGQRPMTRVLRCAIRCCLRADPWWPPPSARRVLVFGDIGVVAPRCGAARSDPCGRGVRE
jgi:hypothetical protein